MYKSRKDDWEPPHDKLSPRLFWVVEAALRKAWEIVTSDTADAAEWRTAKEDDLTLLLLEALSDIVWHSKMVDGFDNTIFSTPNRETKIRNYNGRKPDKMPDLVLQFTNIPSIAKPSQFGIFIECKPVDAKHSVGTHYCGKGIIRFIEGDYAWAMQEGIMLAYAAAGCDTEKSLIPHITSGNSCLFASANVLKRCPKSSENHLAERTLISTHKRDFTYSENNRSAPEIVLRHIWLKR
jgi:hypothetical protein